MNKHANTPAATDILAVVLSHMNGVSDATLHVTEGQRGHYTIVVDKGGTKTGDMTVMESNRQRSERVIELARALENVFGDKAEVYAQKSGRIYVNSENAFVDQAMDTLMTRAVH